MYCLARSPGLDTELDLHYTVLVHLPSNAPGLSDGCQLLVPRS